MLKLNLGSGPNGIKGWVNYDWGVLPVLSKYALIRKLLIKINLLPDDYNISWPEVKLHNLKKNLKEKNESVKFIYCSHVLEHFEKNEAEKILKECHRVLKKTGRLRIVLPDLKKMVLEYKDSDEFNREFYGFDKDLYVGILGNLKKYFIRGHQWMYDKESTIRLLKNAGFKEIEVCSFRNGLLPDLDKLDIESHQKISMYFEAGHKLLK